ncbi:flavo-specific protein antigen FspA [Flavobacterium noncentrifugens]|uniref:Outer membrane protein beta-barrel domain-containing protein n=1 Tax=Flavobacterium noncentrifugens TaxID=1128970 RepID=A0A1G9B214_9FLAO|nr:outer membrane beta-barrel protein [Flavobacterium noncentrifugens]GEP51677.1 flavo-specific protein antigen FspA [Flavobacterium noncentrifugens]SDK33582.1 Outer membrane protein beta-barrel domain-containing protein [Flavobacterium noncentrifugens]
MKKFLLLAALAVISFANAQKGTVLVMGNIGYESTKQDQVYNEATLNTFTFGPKVGYQFNDHWTVGVEANIASSKEKHAAAFPVYSFTEQKNSTFAAGAFVRYSRALSETFAVYADLGAGLQNAKTTLTQTEEFGTTSATYKGNGMYVGLTPALFINFKKSFGLNFSIGGLGYETLNQDHSVSDNRRFYFNFGKTINIGISKNF